jgi:hypothetical protein
MLDSVDVAMNYLKVINVVGFALIVTEVSIT